MRNSVARLHRSAFSISGSKVEPMQDKALSQATASELCDFRKHLGDSNSGEAAVVIPLSDLNRDSQFSAKKDQHSDFDSNLTLYFRDISKIQVLTRHQEIDLAQQIAWWNTMILQTLAQFPPATDLLLGQLEEVQRAGRRPTGLVTGLLDRTAVGLGADSSLDVQSANCLAAAKRFLQDPHRLPLEIPTEAINPDLIDAHLETLSDLRSSLTALTARLGLDHELCKKQHCRLSIEFASLKLAPAFRDKLVRWVVMMFESTADGERQDWCIHPDLLITIKKEIALGLTMLARIKDEFIQANLKLVVYTTRRYPIDSLAMADLIQEGNIGLLKAVDCFDYRKGFRFSTYASYWIRLAISRAIAKHTRTVWLPFRTMDRIHSVNKVQQQLVQKYGREARLKEISQTLEISRDAVEDMRVLSQNAISLDAPLSDDRDTDSMHTLIEQTIFSPAFAVRSAHELDDLVKNAIESLSSKQARIVRARFGIGGSRESTLQELADELGLTRERVRQIQVMALDKLKKRFGDVLHDFLD